MHDDLTVYSKILNATTYILLQITLYIYIYIFLLVTDDVDVSI